MAQVPESSIEQMRVMAADMLAKTLDPYASKAENLEKLRQAYAEQIQTLSAREQRYFQRELSNQLAASRTMHFIDAASRSQDVYDYDRRSQKLMKSDLLTLRDLQGEKRISATPMQTYTEEERKILNRLLDGSHLSDVCKDPSVLTDAVLAQAAEMYPLDTLRYLKEHCPEKITPEFAYAFAVHMACGLNATDAEQFDLMKIQDELRSFPRDVQQKFQTGIWYAQKANRMDFMARQDQYVKRPLPTAQLEQRRIANLERSKFSLEDAANQDRDRFQKAMQELSDKGKQKLQQDGSWLSTSNTNAQGPIQDDMFRMAQNPWSEAIAAKLFQNTRKSRIEERISQSMKNVRAPRDVVMESPYKFDIINKRVPTRLENTVNRALAESSTLHAMQDSAENMSSALDEKVLQLAMQNKGIQEYLIAGIQNKTNNMIRRGVGYSLGETDCSQYTWDIMKELDRQGLLRPELSAFLSGEKNNAEGQIKRYSEIAGVSFDGMNNCSPQKLQESGFKTFLVEYKSKNKYEDGPNKGQYKRHIGILTIDEQGNQYFSENTSAKDPKTGRPGVQVNAYGRKYRSFCNVATEMHAVPLECLASPSKVHELAMRNMRQTEQKMPDFTPEATLADNKYGNLLFGESLYARSQQMPEYQENMMAMNQ